MGYFERDISRRVSKVVVRVPFVRSAA